MYAFFFFFLQCSLWGCRNNRPGVEVFQNKNLQDLVEVLNGGTVQVLLVVTEGVPHGREGGRDKVEDVYT